MIKRKKLKTKYKVIIAICIAICLAIACLLEAVIIYRNTVNKIGESAFTPNETVKVAEGYVNKYNYFIDDEKAYYIEDWCKTIDIDPNLVMAILMQENPDAKIDAVSKPNINGSVDMGLFQLNSKYVYTTFKDAYWEFDKEWMTDPAEFNPMNWQHNSYVAIRLIKDLYDTFNGDIEKIAAGYNCGTGRTLKGNLPAATIAYQKSVLNYYNALN